MIEYLNEIRRKYDLNIGNHCLSPIMQASVALSMEYIASIENIHNQEPFHICFPVKEYSSLWLSIALLRNFFLTDYVYQNKNRVEYLGLKANDKIEIFGCVATYKGIQYDTIRLEFKKGTICNVDKIRIPYINQTNKKALNLYSKYSKITSNQKKQTSQRNAISKIIEPNENVLVNRQILISKVMIVAGRGNTIKLLDRMKSTEVHNESLSSIFQVNKNLIIKPDLDDYKSCFDSEYLEKRKNFKKMFLASFERVINLLDAQFVESFVLLKQYVEDDQFHDELFLSKYDEFLENFDRRDHPILFNVHDKLPSISIALPENLKAVVLNDIELLELYPDTVKGFINKKIPVIVILDRHIGSKSLINLYNNFFSKHPESLRINWNKKKILAIPNNNTNEVFLDKYLWDSCKRYAEQQIEIEIFDRYSLDNILPNIQRLISGLEGFEKLKSSYWKFFQPAAYGVKNSFANNISIQFWANKFETEFVNVKNIIDKEVSDAISEGLRQIREFCENTKKPNKAIPVFRQNYGKLDGREFFAPSCCDMLNIDMISAQTNMIQFVGFPLNEPLCKILLNSACEYFIPIIKILAGPNEGDLTHRYLFRRLYSAFFTDYLKTDWRFPEELLLKNDQDFEDEIISFLKITGKVQESIGSSIEDEDNIFTINSYKYNQYQEKNESTANYPVKCNTIDFDDNQFMFVPHTSKVLAQIETADGSIKFKRASFNELKVGYKIYEYKLSRSQRRTLLQDEIGLHEAFKDLYLWKDSLNFLHGELGGKGLEMQLFNTQEHCGPNGNPSWANIQRWLYDEEMLSPDNDNLRIIFTAAENHDVESAVLSVRKAYKLINAFNIRLSSNIKKKIIALLNENTDADKKNIKIHIREVDLDVETRTIIGLQAHDKLIDYHNTRKILD